jgi:hypothetical protein
LSLILAAPRQEKGHFVVDVTYIPVSFLSFCGASTVSKAVIYQPTKSAMQSGRGNTKKWVVEFDNVSPRRVEPLMGWTGSDDTNQQVRMRFDDCEKAVAYCEKHGIDYSVKQPHKRKFRVKSYSDNFGPTTVRGPGTDPI